MNKGLTLSSAEGRQFINAEKDKTKIEKDEGKL